MQTKPKPAGFFTPIEELTEHELLYRLLISLQNLPGSTELNEEEIIKLPSEVYEYWRNSDHGLAHSKQVLARALIILRSCPNLLRLCYMRCLDPIEITALITWASILHDFARFTQYKTLPIHQLVGSELARHAFIEEVEDHVSKNLAEMIIRHDYCCEFVDREQLPTLFIKNPLAEMFRLADKTSLSPVDEITRYNNTGKRLGKAKFFDPDFPMESRLQFNGRYEGWDYLNHFLLFFAIQPKDWFFGETRDLYREWQEKCEGGKSKACAKILEFAAAEGLDGDQIYSLVNVLDSFFKKFNLPNYVG